MMLEGGHALQRRARAAAARHLGACSAAELSGDDFEPDHDGDSHRGHRLRVQGCGRVLVCGVPEEERSLLCLALSADEQWLSAIR